MMSQQLANSRNRKSGHGIPSGPVVYTDGSCNPNPGPGGWGFVSIDPDGDWMVNGGEADTTNNRMELTAIVEALKFHASAKTITIYTDSKLCLMCAQKLWKRKKNADLWALYDRAASGKTILWRKVKAHRGDKYNEMVDLLAKEGVPDSE